MIQREESSLFGEEDYLINLLNKNNVLVGGFKQKKKAVSQTEKNIIKQASKDEGEKAKKEKQQKKAEAKKIRKEKNADAKIAIEQSKSIYTKNLKSRVEVAKDGINKENIKKIDNLAKDDNYRSELRKIVSEDISKLDNAKIDEMMPKDLSIIIKGVESKTKKSLSIDEKSKILAEYKINMIDTKTFEDGSSGFKRRMQQSIYNIHSISHGRMSGLELSKNNTKTVSNAVRNLKNKEGMGNPKEIGNIINKRKEDSNYKIEKQNLELKAKNLNEQFKIKKNIDFIDNFKIDNISRQKIINDKILQLQKELNEAKTDNIRNSKANEIVDIQKQNADISRYEELMKKYAVKDKTNLQTKLGEELKQLQQDRNNALTDLEKLKKTNPDKEFKVEDFKNEILNKNSNTLKELEFTSKNVIENLNIEIKGLIDKLNKNPDNVKQIQNQIDLFSKQIRVDNEKLKILQQKQTDTTKTALTKKLEKQGFSKNEINKAIDITKNKELFGDTIKDKMSELEFIIVKTIKSPDLIIKVNADKITNLQSKLEDPTNNKMEQSKLRRQITDLETANKQLEKRKSIMNNSGNSASKRKYKGKLVDNIDKKLSRVDKNLRFFENDFEKLSKKQKENPNDLTPGDKAKIKRYEQFQQNKSRLESRKSELQTQIGKKTFNKITKGVNTNGIKKMDTKDFEIFKTTMDGKLDTPEKKKEFQTRFEDFKDALDKGSNSLAKSHAQFIKAQYGIDVKEFKLDNLSKMGEFYKNNVSTLDKKREVGSLLNKSQELKKRGRILAALTGSKNKQANIMKKLGTFNSNILKQVQTEGVKKIEKQKKDKIYQRFNNLLTQQLNTKTRKRNKMVEIESEINKLKKDNPDIAKNVLTKKLKELQKFNLKKQSRITTQQSQLKAALNKLEANTTESLVGGHLPKRLHPKKKYSKKAYQFSKSKNRTKKQLI